jgi:hypothetical protein
MKKLILLALVLTAFITFSFRLIGNKGGASTKSQATNQPTTTGGFASSDPIN